MSSKRVTIIAIIFMHFHGFRIEALGLVEMISDYARVAKSAERLNTTEAIQIRSDPTTTPLDTTTEPVPDYQDFDDLQEEENKSIRQSSQKETMMKYFSGLVSLLTLMYKFNGSFGGVKPSNLHSKSEPAKGDSTGKYLKEAQERFEFPQKKFRYHEKMKDNMMVEPQLQYLENYPPYDPQKSNEADSYNNDDKKTSYDADLMHYDLTKNTINDYNPDVDIQQSYSYEIPYETPKPAKPSAYSSSNVDITWGDNIHPVYNPIMTKTPAEATYTYNENHKPWKIKIPDTKPFTPEDSDSHQPWNEKPVDLPIYHHDFKDPPLPDAHHIEYQEIDHPMDEDRVSKKPYSYYFLGRKLWYIPLLFSVYFIIYVGALVLKSVARHKIQFPEKIWNLHDEHYSHGKHRRHRKIDEITEKYENALDKMNNKYM